MTGSSLRIKKSSVPGSTPNTSLIAFGELCVNYADGLVYFKDGANNLFVMQASLVGQPAANARVQLYYGS